MCGFHYTWAHQFAIWLIKLFIKSKNIFRNIYLFIKEESFSFFSNFNYLKFYTKFFLLNKKFTQNPFSPFREISKEKHQKSTWKKYLQLEIKNLKIQLCFKLWY